MKISKMLLAAVLMCAGLSALAEEGSDQSKNTTETSKNVITGTKTTTHKYSKKVKDAKGDSGKVNVKETVKEKTDGSVSKDVKVDADSTEKK